MNKSMQHIILPQPKDLPKFEPGKFNAFYISKPKGYWLADVQIDTSTIEGCKNSLVTLAARKAELNQIREALKQEPGYGIYETRNDLYWAVERLNELILYIENCEKCMENGGKTVNVTDKNGHVYKNVPDFTNVDTSEILFDEETILTDPIPKYIPIMNLETLVAKKFAIDAIEVSKDRFLVSNSYKSIYSREYDKYTFNGVNFSLFSILTLDQLVLMSDYYATKQKAVYKDEADRKNQKNLDYWHGLPLEKKSPYMERLKYTQLSASEKKKFSQVQFDAMSIQEKAKHFPAVKKYGAKRVDVSDSAFRQNGRNSMPGSLHYMYEDFVDPTKIIRRPGRGQRIADPVVWDYWEYLKEALKWRLVDISEQRKEITESRKAGMETSYGMSNVTNQLLDSLGVYAKRQNGDAITAEYVEQIKNSFTSVQSVFGGLQKFTSIKPLVISHSANTYMYAMRAIGVFIPSFNAIGVSAKYGPNQFNDTMAHELAHYIDHEIGKQNGRRYLTDDRMSTAAEIAETFRQEMNKKTDSNYLNSSKECFARAMQMHYAIETRGMRAEGVYDQAPPDEGTPYVISSAFVSEKNYTEKIKPLIQTFFEENKHWFVKTTQSEMKQTELNFDDLPDFDKPKPKKSAKNWAPGQYVRNIKTGTIAKIYNVDYGTGRMQLEDLYGNKEKKYFTATDWVKTSKPKDTTEEQKPQPKDTTPKKTAGAKGYMSTRLKMAQRGDFKNYTTAQVIAEARKFQKARTKSGAARDEKNDSQKRLSPTPENLIRWMKEPGKYDLIGVDTYRKDDPTADLKIKKEIFWHRLLKK